MIPMFSYNGDFTVCCGRAPHWHPKSYCEFELEIDKGVDRLLALKDIYWNSGTNFCLFCSRYHMCLTRGMCFQLSCKDKRRIWETPGREIREMTVYASETITC
ncbi:uncharacterized protein LOC26527391 [Drosophila mojavensis]|uniref:Uncharacterized protein, isoform A n=1 Tax=Drosophila mojavensis TaxID=7230 RepID=A0A0Q9X1Q1_DROMO|nr:uncharacterized protein LOC26527391 [Drosophila mojavensis]KRG01999.1 uncharacterized protein Dmoj_GI25750, isoform A [Drosophila mojavensis]